MDCLYKFEGKEYSLEALEKILKERNSAGDVNINQTSPARSLNTKSTNPSTIAVRSNPFINGANTQAPYPKIEDQIKAFPILANSEDSIQVGTELTVTKGDWNGQPTYELRDKNGVYIGSLKDANTFKFEATADNTVEELRAAYMAQITNIDALITSNTGNVVINVTGKDIGILLNLQKNQNLTSEQQEHSVEQLIGNDIEAKLVNIQSKNGKDFKITVDGKESPLVSSGFDVNLEDLRDLWSKLGQGAFRSMILLPTPVRTAKGIFYKLVPTIPTKVFSSTNPKTQFPEFTNTIKAVVEAVKSKNFSSVESLDITDINTAATFLRAFFIDTKVTIDKDSVQIGSGKGTVINNDYNVETSLQDKNIVLTFTPDNQMFKLFGADGTVIPFSYKTIAQRLHTTTFNPCTVIEGKPRTYFSNPQVAIDLNNPKINSTVTFGNTVEPTNNDEAIEKSKALIYELVADKANSKTVDKNGESVYSFMGKFFQRISNFVGEKIQFDRISSVTNLKNALPVGDYFDTLGRLFFNNENVTIEEFKEALIKHPKASQFVKINTEKIFTDNIEKFKVIKQSIKEQLNDNNLTFIADEIFVHQEFKTDNGLDGIAGTLDMVVIDSQGKIHVYDFKTSSENSSKATPIKLDSPEYGTPTSEKWSKQQSAYSQLLSNTFGYTPDINIIVIPVTYTQQQFVGDFADTKITDAFKPLPANVKISSKLFLHKLVLKENTKIPKFGLSKEKSPTVTEPTPVKKVLKGKGDKSFTSPNKGGSKALDTDQITRLIALANGNKIQNTLELVKSITTELASDLLEGLSFAESKNRIKEQLQDNLERAEILSTLEGIEENIDSIFEYEKSLEYNAQAVLSINEVLGNFDEFFTNAENLLATSGFDKSEGTYKEEEDITSEEGSSDVTSDDSDSVNEQGISEKIHNKSALEYNPFFEMNGKAKAFLSTISKETASFLNMNASYGAEQLFAEIADLVDKFAVDNTEAFKRIIEARIEETDAHHLKDFLHKFNRITIENQNGLVKEFSLTKNRLVASKNGNVFDSNRNARSLQLKNFIESVFTDKFLSDADTLNIDAITELRDYVQKLIDKDVSVTLSDSQNIENLFNQLNFGFTPEQKQQIDHIFITNGNMEYMYFELRKSLNQLLTGQSSLGLAASRFTANLTENGVESVLFSNRGNVIINKDGNKIYIYSVPNSVAETNKRISTYKGLLQKNPFSSFSTLASKIDGGKAVPIYLDGVNDKSFSKLDFIEKMFAKATFFFKTPFKNGKNYPFFSSAKSDKTPVNGLEIPKVNYTYESAIEAFFNILKAEKARMTFADDNTISVLGYEPNQFYLFPELNKGGEFDLKFQNGKDNKVDFAAISDAELKSKAVKLFEKYLEITKHQLKNYTYKNNKGDMVYLSESEYRDFMVNEMVNNYEYMATYSNDPAFAGKGSLFGTLTHYFKRLASDIATSQRVPNLPNFDTVVLPDDIQKSTEFETRLKDLDNLTMEQFNALLEEDTANKSVEGYKSKVKALKSYPYYTINSADAQGYMSLKRYIQILLNQNKLSLAKHDAILEKINNVPNGDIANLVLTDEELADVLIQAIKPVVVGNQEREGLLVRNYIKLSSFPLLPQMYAKDDKCLEYAQFMHNNDVNNIVFKSGYKLGSPPLIEDLKSYDAEKHLVSLDSNFFGIQQEVPYDENKTLLLQGSQILKLLFNNISNPELKEEFYTLQSELVNDFLNNLKTKLGISLNSTGNLKVDFNQLQKTLLKEFKKKGLDPQDIENFSVKADGSEFNIPLLFNKLGGKIETTIFSMLKKLSKTKLGGKSYVLVSDHGFSGLGSAVTTTKSYNASKGLQPMRIVDGKVLPAQIMITWDFQDAEGNILDINDFKNDDGTLNLDLLPKDLLEGIGYRIPTQGHNSMAYAEIVGFLPKYMGSTVIASKDFVAQMGSDFDIDKLYFHKKTYKFLKNSLNYKGKGVGKFVVEGTKISDKTDTEPAVYKQSKENRIVEIYMEVLKSSETFNKIVSPLGFGNLPQVVKDLKARSLAQYNKDKESLIKLEESLKDPEIHPQILEELVEDINGLKDKIIQYEVANNLSILHPAVQNNNYEVGTAGKDCVGRSSLLSVFSAVIQNSGLKLLELRKIKNAFTGKEEVVGFSPKVQIGNKIIALSSLDASEPLIKTPNSIEETENDVISAFQSAAVDNASELLLNTLNYNVDTHNILTAMAKLRLDSQFISYFLTHPIVKDVVGNSFNSKLSINSLPPLNYDRLKEGTESTDIVEAYATFFNNVGKELNGVSTGLNVTSKGFGESLEALDSVDSMIPSINSDYLDNISAVYNLPYFNIGLNNIGLVKNFTSRIFGLTQNTYFGYRQLVNANKIDGYSGVKTKTINNFFKSFIFNQAELFTKGDIDGIRNRLFYGKNSLQNRLNILKKENPNEILFKYLSPLTTAQDSNDTPKFIRSDLFNIENALDKLQWKLDFEEAYFNTSSPYHKFIKDMVAYTYLTGGVQDTNSIVSSIPSTVIRDFQKGLYTETLLENEDKGANVAFQFFQHFPEALKTMDQLPEFSGDTAPNMAKDFESVEKVPAFIKFVPESIENFKEYIGYAYKVAQNPNGTFKATYILFETKGVAGMKEITAKPTNKSKRLVTENEVFKGLNFETGNIDTITSTIINSLDSSNLISKNFKFLQEVLKAQGNNIKVVVSNSASSSRGSYENGVITLYAENIATNDELLEVFLHEMTHSVIDRYLDGESALKTAPKEIQDVIVKLKRLQRSFTELTKTDGGGIKGLTKLELKEFVAYVISNKDIQEWMNSYKVNQENSPEGFWDKMANLIKELVTSISNSLGLTKLSEGSFATIALNEVENLLKATKTSSELLKNNEDYKDKLRGNWEEVKLEAHREGLLPANLLEDIDKKRYVLNNKAVFEGLVNKVATESTKDVPSTETVTKTQVTSKETSSEDIDISDMDALMDFLNNSDPELDSNGLPAIPEIPNC